MNNNWLLHLRRAEGIARRYFITNGFDGALTMLGLMVGFHVSQNVSLAVALNACLGAAVALFMSGISSAYLSETAERKKELRELERALITDLSDSDYGRAIRFVPIFVALTNGLSPLLFSLVIVSPVWLTYTGHLNPGSPFLVSIIVAFCCLFLLGVVLGKLGKEFWLWSGLRILLIAGVTTAIIFWIEQ